MKNQKITISVIKADVGSIGGHTEPSEAMIKKCEQEILNAKSEEFIIDGLSTYTGDDLCLIMVHSHGLNSGVHQFAYEVFKETAEIAKKEGMYAAGQDLRGDAPSGNIRGAGPGIAEIEFLFLPKHRPAEAFLVFTADKCGPGVFNAPFYKIFVDPNINRGLMIAPNLTKGFIFEIIDMEYKGEFLIKDTNQRVEDFFEVNRKKAKDGEVFNLKSEIVFKKPEGNRIIQLDSVDRQGVIHILALLRDIDRFGVTAVYSKAFLQEQVLSVSTTRLHNIAGVYIGKDDPTAIVRTQGIFPATEEAVTPFTECDFVTGDCRGSHIRSLTPMPICTAVRGAECIPIVSCLAFSLSPEGKLSRPIDMFAGKEWDYYRQKADEKNEYMRRQGAFGCGMASQTELAYTGLMDLMTELEKRFFFSKN